MPNTTPEKNNEKTDQNAPSLETKVMLLEERIKEMEKILTMLNPSQKVGPTESLISVLRRLPQTDLSLEIQMARLNRREANEKERNEFNEHL